MNFPDKKISILLVTISNTMTWQIFSKIHNFSTLQDLCQAKMTAKNEKQGRHLASSMTLTFKN